MIAVTQTVVHEDTMMVKLLNAPVAEVAVICIFWSQSFARHANIIKMIVFSD